MLRLFVAVATTLLLGACFSAGEDDTGSSEDDVTPQKADTLWKLATLCGENITRHTALRRQELADGVVRWQCGDRPGVDGEADRGQEYCEYFAVSGGKRVQRLPSDKSTPLACVFTSLFADAEVDTAALARALSSADNLDAEVAPDIVAQKSPFNTRRAASALMRDATAIPRQKGSEDEKRHLRTAACFVESGRNKTKAAALRKACEADLSSDAGWRAAQELGVEVLTAKSGESYQLQQDLFACMAVRRLSGGGVDWRMSDPRITQVTVRATEECSCEYSALPDALKGFPMGTWSSATELPAGCRRAVIEGKPYELFTICSVSDEDRTDIELNLDHADNLQAFCNERFGKDIVLTAPLRAVERPGTCKSSGSAFCEAFTNTAKK